MTIKEHLQISRRGWKHLFSLEKRNAVLLVLKAFLSSIIEYIPIYFNLDECKSHDFNCHKELIKESLENGKNLSIKYNKPVCYIFDGMRQSVYNDECAENYLVDISNKKESILKYFDMEFSDDVIDKIIDKYKLENSNYIVDLLYEALIFESNNK